MKLNPWLARCVDEFPSNAEYHEWLGRLEVYRGKWELAAEQLSRAVELKPDDPGFTERPATGARFGRAE